MRQRQRPQAQVGCRVGDGAQHELNGVDGLVHHDLPKVKLLGAMGGAVPSGHSMPALLLPRLQAQLGAAGDRGVIVGEAGVAEVIVFGGQQAVGCILWVVWCFVGVKDLAGRAAGLECQALWHLGRLPRIPKTDSHFDAQIRHTLWQGGPTSPIPMPFAQRHTSPEGQ